MELSRLSKCKCREYVSHDLRPVNTVFCEELHDIAVSLGIEHRLPIIFGARFGLPHRENAPGLIGNRHPISANGPSARIGDLIHSPTRGVNLYTHQKFVAFT